MALLDQLLTEGVRQYQPEIKPWNESGFLTNAAQYGNIKERNAEIQRQNSIRNLIAQREKDGIPFDRLADEVAKYDLNTAMNMQNAAQNSIKFNRGESEAELANHKRTMAGWLGGEVLRRAQEAVSSGNAQWDIDYVVNVCNECASVIYPYDPEGARALMSYANGLTGKKLAATSKEKKGNDHEKYISDLTTKEVPNKDENPSNFAETTAQQHAAQAILRYKNATGNDIWLRQVQWLLKEAKDRFGKYSYGSVDLDNLRAWLDGLTPDQIAGFIGNINDPTVFNMDTGIEIPAETQKPENGNGNVPSVNNTVSRKSGNGSTESAPSLLSIDPGSKKKKLSTSGVAAMQTFIDAHHYDNAALRDARKRLNEGMSFAEGTSGGSENTAMSGMLKQVDELLKHNEEMGGDKSTPAFKKAFDKLLSTGRTATSLNAMMTAFHNVVASADKSQSALTFLNSILLAQLPFYKPTDYDAKVALTIKGANSFDNLKSVIKDMDIPIFSTIANYSNIDAAIDAALQDFTRTFNGLYNNWVADASEEEAKEIINGAKSRWNLGPRDITVMRDGKLPIGKARLDMMKKAAEEYGDSYADDYGRTIDSKTGKVLKDENGNPVVESETPEQNKVQEAKSKLGW